MTRRRARAPCRGDDARPGASKSEDRAPRPRRPLEDVNPDLVEPDPAPRREFVTGELPYRHRVAPSESDSDLSDDDVPNLVENFDENQK